MYEYFADAVSYEEALEILKQDFHKTKEWDIC